MAKKITVVGASPKKIEVADQPKRRIEPAELAAAVGAEPCGQQASRNQDPIALAELGTQLLNRLRSSGGRPALSDATETCRVPLSADDVKTLEKMVSRIEEATGTKPSIGQMASVILRLHLEAFKNAPAPDASVCPSGKGEESAVPLTLVRQMIASLRQIIDEKIHPVRERLALLETQLQGAGQGDK